MIKKIILLFIMTIVSLHAYANDINVSAQQAYINKKIQSFMQEYAIPGVAMILYVNGHSYEYYYGYANLEEKNPVINKTIFELGSLSKIMTSVLFAQEMDWAKMGLTDPISKYIKNLPDHYDNINLQNLATHTSGLSFSTSHQITTLEELTTFLNRSTPTMQPNKQWYDSNLGTTLLLLSLENSTESDFGDLYRRHILNPLKMVNGVTIPEAYNKYYAQGYDRKGRVVARASNQFPGLLGIKASVSDMQHFLAAAIGLPGTPPRVFYPMRMTQSVYVKMTNGYQGLGWFIHSIGKNNIHSLLNGYDMQNQGPFAIQEIYQRPLYSGDVLIDKAGVTAGFGSYIAVIPNQLSGIVILANKNIPEKYIAKVGREILFKCV